MMLFETYSDEKEIEAVTEVLNRGTWWLNGPEVTGFENKISEYVNNKYAVSFNSGTSALFTIFSIISDQNNSDEIILPSFTYPATANAAYAAGLTPIFTDIESDTYGLEINSISENITDNTVAICPVHFAGGVAKDIEKIVELAEDHDIYVIEDAAQSLGAELNGQKAGTFGDVGIYSFSFNKIISTGAGGMLITDSENIKNSCRYLSKQGKNDNGNYISYGYNFSMSSINAAIGLAQMKKIDSMIFKRRELASIYENQLREINEITPAIKSEMIQNNNQYKVFQMYNILCDSNKYRNELKEHLEDNDIPTRISYNPVHKNTFYSNFNSDVILPVTQDISNRILTLPFHLYMNRNDIINIINTIKRL